MQDRLNIVRVASDIYPEIIGGAAIHAHELSKAQAEMGHEVTVITSNHGDQTLPEQEERAGYYIYRCNEWFDIFGNSIAPSMLRDIIDLYKDADVVHAHSHLYFSTNIAALISRILDAPLIITNHGLYSQSAPKSIQDIHLSTITRCTYGFCDRILCYTDTDKQRLIDRGIRTNIEVVHNGIDTNQFKPIEGIEQKKQILFVGRLVESKGPHILLEAFLDIHAKHPDWSLKFVGEGPLKTDLSDMVISNNLESKISFVGSLPNNELPTVYSESAIFALPSRVEGFPRTLLESLACETPIITSDLPQLASVLSNVGYITNGRTGPEIKKGLQTLMTEDSRRKRMGKNGRELVRSDFSWNETVQSTTDIYYDLIQS